MINLDDNFKKAVLQALADARTNFTGSDAMFAKQHNLSPAIYSRLKTGVIQGIIKEATWLAIGRKYNVSVKDRKWNIARTEVFKTIEEEIQFCKEFSKARIFVDDCEIGKTFTAKYLSRNLENCFYVDCSQAKSKTSLIKLLASVIGIETTGSNISISQNIKYYLNILPQPIVILDEAGDLDYPAFLFVKELWNGTEDQCGYYMMGADGLMAKIEKGINGKKVGYREIFSRFSGKVSSITPIDRQEKYQWYRRLVTDVLTVNTENKGKIDEIVKKSLININEKFGGLRRAESLLILNQ